jgi:peptide-methionine (S)-S-oxide reductase
MEIVVLGGGCFWCTEALYKQLKGVNTVVSGYAGGHTKDPTYEQMHYEDTGHAEVVQITFDPKIISYRELLEIFFAVHDPTTPGRQGNDVGKEYRSVILYIDERQKAVAEDVIKNFASQHWEDPIVTELKKLDMFYPAEDYHQNFFEKNPEQAYCQVVINPKLAKFRQKFPKKLKT